MENRFEVSTVGMAKLHEGRPLVHLVKELPANSFDTNATVCVVFINKAQYGGRDMVFVQVSDNGPGFTDIRDSYTLMAPTPKRADPTARGRFNIGEKELLSVAHEAKVTTRGHTVFFPKEGGRREEPNERGRGTEIEVWLDGRIDEIDTAVATLRTFLPPKGIKYVVNGDIVPYRTPSYTTATILPTVLASGPNEPMRSTTRKTAINIYKAQSDKGHLYEMGIPVQEIDMPYDVDVMQKVPLPPNRDVVSSSYLQKVYSAVLEATIHDLAEDVASDTWVRQAVEDPRTSNATVKAVMDKKLGDDAMLTLPFDKEANEDAFSAGKTLINPKSLSKIERERFKDVGLSTAHQFARPAFQPPLGLHEITDDMGDVREYAVWLAELLLGFKVRVDFVNDPKATILACYGAKNLTFNIGKLGKGFFKNAPTEAQTAIILHELSHDRGSEVRSHGTDYVRTQGDIGSKAIHLALTLGKDNWWRKEGK